MTIGILFWFVTLIGVAFGILDYKGDPANHRWGYLTWIVILVDICLLGYKVFPFNS